MTWSPIASPTPVGDLESDPIARQSVATELGHSATLLQPWNARSLDFPLGREVLAGERINRPRQITGQVAARSAKPAGTPRGERDPHLQRSSWRYQGSSLMPQSISEVLHIDTGPH